MSQSGQLKGWPRWRLSDVLGCWNGRPAHSVRGIRRELFVEAASGGAQVGEHGQDAAVGVFGVGDVELGEQAADVGLDCALAEE
jgi:hypothetical protein